jgi:hypothetical protein
VGAADGDALGKISDWASTDPPNTELTKTSVKLVAMILCMLRHAAARR